MFWVGFGLSLFRVSLLTKKGLRGNMQKTRARAALHAFFFCFCYAHLSSPLSLSENSINVPPTMTIDDDLLFTWRRTAYMSEVEQYI